MKFIKGRETVLILFIIVALFFLASKFVNKHIQYNSFSAYAQATNWQVKSPDNSVVLSLSLNPNTGELVFGVTKNEVTVIESSTVGLVSSTTNYTFSQNLSIIDTNTSTINETYTLPIGKKSSYLNHANELTLTVQNSSGNIMNLILRAYNDGIAYRYIVPSGITTIASEKSTFNIPNTATLWVQPYINNYESEYQKIQASTITGRMGIPVLASEDNSNWVFITEAETDGKYPLFNLTSGSDGNFMFTPPPDESLPIEVTASFNSPWRVAILGSLSDIVESTLVQNLNPASSITNNSWIKPGRVAWSWWSDHDSPKSLQTQKDYVDFAAEMGWEYILVDEGWSSSWVQELVNYANSKNVGVITWHFFGDFTQWTPNGWMPSYQNAFNKFQQLKNWGVKGAKIDFFDSDSQIRTQTKEEIYKAAAATQMFFNFHGATLPRGEQRRWPHFLTQEGVKGAEHLNNNASHTTVLPFTRNVTGSMDYTPVTFSASGNTTYAHQLAQAIVYESALQHFADSKETYRTISASELLKIVPTTWDDTKLLSGYPGDNVVIARRKGNDWFIGAMVSSQKNFSIPLNFLSGTYNATLYLDGANATTISKTTQQLKNTDILTFTTLSGGGTAIHLKYVSGSTTSTPTPTPKPGDCEPDGGDSDIDIFDYNRIVSNFGSSTNLSCDFVNLGSIDIFDYNVVVSNFGT